MSKGQGGKEETKMGRERPEREEERPKKVVSWMPREERGEQSLCQMVQRGWAREVC